MSKARNVYPLLAHTIKQKSYKPFDSKSSRLIYQWWESLGLFSPVSNEKISASVSSLSADNGSIYAKTSGLASNSERDPSRSLSDAKMKKIFSDNLNNGKYFSMVIPPPNVTGQLHLGHALTVTIQDSLARYQRMKRLSAKADDKNVNSKSSNNINNNEDDVVYIPGLDHAGIATQTVVEKELMKTQGKSRHDLGRIEFVNAVWKWKEKYGSRINEQLKEIGASLDWTREAFTMDSQRSHAVIEAFNILYERDLIYRANRMVSWCPYLQTVISDLEVLYEDITAPKMISVPEINYVLANDKKKQKRSVEVGVAHEFHYKVIKDNKDIGLIPIRTTRLETMLGDVAVAIHPNDSRYFNYHGCEVEHPFTRKRLPILLDSILVDPSMGTGAVKITPAHDINDYECTKRHNVSFDPNGIFDDKCNIKDSNDHLSNNIPKKYIGMNRFDARLQLVEDLKKENLYIGKFPHPMKISLCSRSGDIIEPMLKPQWFIRSDKLAKQALKDVLETKKIIIEPSHHIKHWQNWLTDAEDWCISRQLWWGHRIPAWQLVATNKASSEINSNTEAPWFIGRDEQEAKEKAMRYLKADNLGGYELKQDPDVLDTWFSSGLFPLTTLGWPNMDQEDIKRYYPLSILETGSDILFFWVARMVMLCTELSGEVPFKRVFLHPMLRDRRGRKMSKSLGNVIDPLDVSNGISLEKMIENLKTGNLDPKEIGTASKDLSKEYPEGIPACGPDSLRFALGGYLDQGVSINMDVNRAVQARAFANKIWNAVMFSEFMHDQYSKSHGGKIVTSSKPTLFGRWIKSLRARMVDECLAAYEKVDISHVTKASQKFLHYSLCDVHIEICKHGPKKSPEWFYDAIKDLDESIEAGLLVLHPIMPFFTEDLWQRVQYSKNKNDSNNNNCDEGNRKSIMQHPFPQYDAKDIDESAERTMDMVLDIVRSIRSIKARLNSVGIPFSSQSSDLGLFTISIPSNNLEPDSELLTNPDAMDCVCLLARVNSIEVNTNAVDLDNHGSTKSMLVESAISGKATVSIDVSSIRKQLSDENIKKIREQDIPLLEKKIAKLQSGYEQSKKKYEGQMNSNTPKEILERLRSQFLDASNELDIQQKILKVLKSTF